MKKKNKTRSVTGLLFGFMERVSGDHVGAYATQAAYFLIMSFIPCILFLTTLVRYTPCLLYTSEFGAFLSTGGG